MLELMARGGMRVGEVLNLTPVDIQERTLAIKNPKSGRVGEAVYVPRKILVRLYVASQIQEQSLAAVFSSTILTFATRSFFENGFWMN